MDLLLTPLVPRACRLLRHLHVRGREDALPVPDAALVPVAVDAPDQGHRLAFLYDSENMVLKRGKLIAA